MELPPNWTKSVESRLLTTHCRKNEWQNMQSFKLFLLSMKMQYNIIKLNTGSIPFSNRKNKVRGKTSNERKKWKKKKYCIHEYKFPWSAWN